MLKKLTMVILASGLFLGIFSSNIIAKSFEKITPQRIPLNQIAPPPHTPLTGGKGFCLIQSDSLTDTLSYSDDFQSGDGVALYMDPAKCGVQNPYIFKITDVHFYLYDPGGCTWPVEIRVIIRDLKQGGKCNVNGPGDSLCSETFTIPEDSSANSLLRPMNLTIVSPCSVYSPFFLEIKYTGGTSSPYPSLLMTDTTDAPDTCDAWFLWHGNSTYYEWYDTWFAPVPGYPIMRITGDARFTGVEEEEETGITPKDFALYQSYPNPFNNQTIIKYDLSKSCQVTLTIYNILGQKVRILVDEPKRLGSYEVIWDGKDEKGKDVSSGIYFYQLSIVSMGKVGEITQTKRMILLK